MMNFDGLDPGLGEYPPALHGALEAGIEPSLDPHLNPSLMGPGVELDPEALAVAVPETVHLVEGMFSELHSVVSEVGIPVTATHFDLQEEMLWMGNHRGHATSFFGPTMGRYSSFQVHASDDIRHIQSLETGVLFLSKNDLKCCTRGGIVMFDYPMEAGADMHSLLMTDNNTVLMGGLQNYVVEVDLNTVQETQKFTVEVPGVAIMRQTSRFFFCGHTSGKVTLRDLRSFKTEHEFDAFSGSLSDFDVHGNLLAACGFSSRGLNGLACDRFLMVYDLRMMRAVTPLQVHIDPLFLRFIPTYTSRLAIISQTGQCQFCEPTGLANVADIFHVNTVGQLLMSFDVSASKQALAFGDSGGCVHLWSDAPEVSFNDYSRETEFALPCIVDSLPQLDWTHDLLPLSLIPTPLTSTEPLLSDWAPALVLPCPRRAPPVDPEILRTMKTVGFIGYAANPRTRPRNQVPYKIKDVEQDYDSYNQVPESPIGRDEEPHLYMVPRNSERSQSNTLNLPHIPNAYCNCMIQVLYFLEPIRCLVQNHLCQKSFVWPASSASSSTCQQLPAGFRTIPEASALGLILADSDEQTGKARLGRLIQSWNRFILTQLHQETQEQEGPQAYRGSSSALGSSGDSVIGKLFGCEVENSSLCRCGKETVRSSLTLLFTMHYPEHSSREYDFAEILKRSICLEQSTQAWCENCEKYQPTVQTRNIRCLPDVLVINCEVNSAKEAEFWRVQAEYAFNKAMQKEASEPAKPKDPPPMPTEWCLDAEEVCGLEGLTFDTRAEDLRHQLERGRRVECGGGGRRSVSVRPGGDGASCPGHSDRRKPDRSHQSGRDLSPEEGGCDASAWYLFNDFLIEPIDKTEAVQFDVSWKVPGILYYAKRNYHTKYDLRIKNPIDASVLLTEASLARKQRKSHATFIPLMVSEMPQAGDLVGLDAEFVTLNQVVDYLTQYSGIKPGDLDAKISSKHLTTLKSTYLKLRFLIDTGVRFVGHGLQKDFRVINLFVLKDQVIDTVHLFHLPRKRMISLRFLAWYFLDLNIQGETHDSIEDARTALQLYRKYLDLSRRGGSDEVRKVLKGLYEKGRQLDWKVPESEAGAGDASGAAVFPSVMGL
ncbi:hypothetical protein WMY93_027529 [Mugilogobius chulae]|uniref:USP domain-containing protein n=1 Tax=Mugilogobius chulae TaxID=88201 RepID=A0AAW0MU91_9GOBI